MKLLAVNCNHCGAPLEVAAKARFVTCEFCGTQLKIQQTEEAVWTELLEEIGQTTEKVAQDIGEVRRHQRLETIDKQWEDDPLSFRDGSEPTEFCGRCLLLAVGRSAFVLAILAIFVAFTDIVSTTISWSHGEPIHHVAIHWPEMDFLGVVQYLVIAALLVGAIILTYRSYYAEQNYRMAFRTYQRQREQIANVVD